MDPNSTDALFEIIRKELNTIIENGEKKENAAENKQAKGPRDQEKINGTKDFTKTLERPTTSAKSKQEELLSQKSKNEGKAGALKDQEKLNIAKEGIPSPKNPTRGGKSTGLLKDRANEGKKDIPKSAKSKQAVLANERNKSESKAGVIKGKGKLNNANKDTQAKHQEESGDENNKDETKTDQPSRMRAGMLFDLEKLGNEPDIQKAFADDIATRRTYLNSPRSKNIDADVQKMQLELQESYAAFQSISEKFESINFNNLQKRIRDLNLSKKSEILGKERSDELKQVVEEGFKANRLNEYTNKVGEKFSKHSGEFGDIPELSSFFQACTQLEQVLGNLKHHRNEVVHLEDRMRRSAEISINRASLIKKQLEENRFERPYRMESKEEDDVESVDFEMIEN